MSANTENRPEKQRSQGYTKESLIRAAFWVFSAAVVFSPLIFFTDVTRNPYIIQNIIFRSLVYVSLFLFVFSRKNALVFIKTFLDRPLIIYGAVIFLSLLVSFILHPRWESSYIMFWGRRMIFFVFNSLAVFYLSFAMARDKYFRKVLIYSLLITATVASLYAIMQYTGHEFIWPRNLHHYGARSISTFGNPSFFSAFEIVIIMISLWLFFRSQKPWPLAVSVFLVSVNFFSLLITQSRSSWGGFAGAFFLFIIFAFNKIDKKKLIAVVVLMAAISWIFPTLAYNRDQPAVINRITSAVDFSTKEANSSLSQRLLIWGSALRMFKQSPIVGHGWGSFEIRYPVEQGKLLEVKKNYAGLRTHANNAHNEILEELSQVGIVGLAAYLFIWFVFIKKTATAYFKNGSLLLLACAVSALGFGADNFLNVSLNFPMPVLAFWAAAGIAAAESSKGEVILQYKTNYAFLFKAFAAVLGIIFIIGQIRYFKGEMYYFKGFSLSRSGAIAKASDYCKKSWGYYHWNTDNNYELGNCYMRMKEPEKAIWAYTEALKSNPGYDEIYFNLAIAQQNDGQLDEALKNFEKASQINPVSSEYFLSLGNFYLKNEPKKDYKKAEAYYSKAVEIAPDSLDALNNLAYLKRLEGKIDESLKLYQRALKVNPSYKLAEKNVLEVLRQLKVPLKVWHDQASKLVAKKEYSKAAGLYEKIISKNPGDILALFYLGNCRTSLKEYSQASEIYERLVKYFPGEKDFTMNLAKIYFMSGRKDKAVKLIENSSGKFKNDKDVAAFLKGIADSR